MKALVIFTMITALFLTGCATGLNSNQEREYKRMQVAGLLIQEKDPAIGALLGILPGGGSFYARDASIGVVNFLLWPISIFWDPFSGYQGSKAINYEATRYKLDQQKTKEIRNLEDLFIVKKISNEEYILEKRRIEDKYELR